MPGMGPVLDDTRALAAELAGQLRGRVITSADADYDERRRIWNAAADRRPALIARCADAADVRAAVRFAADTGLELAVRSGGHSFPGFSTCDDGIVIDLGAMNAITVEPERRTVRAGAGVLLGELDHATQAHGMAVPAGIVTHTGLAGLTLGGGIGWLQRRFGLTIDQLLSARVVTAGGAEVTASATENADLFWALRGGGGNFGVVTEFEFRLHALGPTVLAGPIVWPLELSPALLRFYREWVKEAPDELTTAVIHRRAPATLPLPPGHQGARVVIVIACYAGPVEDGERALEALRRFETPLLDMCQPKQFVEHQAMLDPTFVPHRHYYFRAHDIGAVNDELIEAFAHHAGLIDAPYSGFVMFHDGGAIARVGDDETAYSGRGAGHTININAIAETAEDLEAQRAWALGLSEAVAPHGTGVYVNFLVEQGEERVRALYGPAKYARLQAVKRAYDPANLFRRNHNIAPSTP
jgi:FAD/FMN-containing dehydrogenase